MELWQILTKDVVMEEMLQLQTWTRKSQDREFVEVVIYPRGYIIKANKDDIEEFRNDNDWVEILMRKVDYNNFNVSIE